MTMAENIRRLRIQYGMTQEELGNHLGVQKSAIRKYESGMVENIPRTSIQKMAELFNVRPSYLMGFEDNTLPQGARMIVRKRLPMLGNVACGEPIFAEEGYDTYIDVEGNTNADFCLTAKGDSMINARIFDGDILFVRSQPSVDNGEIAVVLIDDEATVKRVYYDKENNTITLAPENPMYKPMRYEGEQLSRIRILGKIVSGQYVVE
jgi:repressor LexA